MAVRRHVVVAVLTGATALVALMVVLASNGPRPLGDGAEPGPSTPLASAVPSQGGTRGPADAGGDRPGPGPQRHPRATSASPVAEAPPAAATPASQGLPGLGRDTRLRRAAEAELRLAFPALQVRRGTLAPRHPSRTIPVPRQAEVRSSSITTNGGITQVGLVARVRQPVEAALSFYRTRLGLVGFAEVTTPAVGSGTTVSFRRASDSVAVTARQAHGSTVVSVQAGLRTGD
jgi:hypothetical protein